MDSEIQTCINIWTTAVVSIILVHQIAGRIPGGVARLFFLLPVVYLFITLPFRISSYLIGFATIGGLGWIANFKLLLFAFNQGPLSTTPPLPLLPFTALAILPVQPMYSSSPYEHRILRPIFSLFTFFLVVAASVIYREFIHSYRIFLLYLICLYLGLELIFFIAAALGMELEPPFNEPYLATSLRDFWGHRWNLVVTNTLRSSVYLPVYRLSLRVLSRRWAQPLAIMATFLVSGVMHELAFYQGTRANPTWQLTWFFVLHGFLVVAEAELKRVALNKGWRLHKAVSRLLTLGTVLLTCECFFSPFMIRHNLHLKAIDEVLIMLRFVGLH